MNGIVATRLIHPDLIARERLLDAQVFCGPMVGLLADRRAGRIGRLGGVISEGWRGEESSRAPLYGAANVRPLELKLDARHLGPPEREGFYSVRPGDVLVNKVWPVRAAWVGETIPRHRFDASCYAIRGLCAADGLWTTLCLNQQHLAWCLLRKSGASVLPRIQMAALKSFRFPPTPIAAAPLAQQFADCLNRRVMSRMELLRLQNDVNDTVAAQVPRDANTTTGDGGASTWSGFFSAADVEESLAPKHVAVTARQNQLRREARWVPLSSVVRMAGQSQARLGRAEQSFYYLRLSDVGDDLRLPLSPPRTTQGNRRILAEPLGENDVLLSLLVTSPRTVFVGRMPDVDIHATDHWHRLRFRETPGAWALILQSAPVAAQLRRLATGSVQQFAAPATLGQLVVPSFPLETRLRWHERLRRWQRGRDELEAQWADLRRRGYELLKQTERQYGPWLEPFDSEDTNQ